MTTLLRLFIPADWPARQTACEWELVNAAGARLQLGCSEPRHWPPADSLELILSAEQCLLVKTALPKGARAEWLFEHGTELGIARFRPLVFARSQSGARDGRRARWERIVRAACEQCDRSHLPLVDDETELAALLRDRELPDARFAAVPGAVTALTPPGTRAALLLVGPEGGLTDAERAALAEAGFQACSLGALTLRTETAALVGAARLLA